jgi:hypothetical protein
MAHVAKHLRSHPTAVGKTSRPTKMPLLEGRSRAKRRKKGAWIFLEHVRVEVPKDLSQRAVAVESSVKQRSQQGTIPTVMKPDKISGGILATTQRYWPGSATLQYSKPVGAISRSLSTNICSQQRQNEEAKA